jgi:hypothetical protein
MADEAYQVSSAAVRGKLVNAALQDVATLPHKLGLNLPEVVTELSPPRLKSYVSRSVELLTRLLHAYELGSLERWAGSAALRGRPPKVGV